MTRLGGKTVIERSLDYNHISPDFDKSEFEGAIANKGYICVHEKAYLCPCKSKESDHRDVCKNCAGTGWIFANPTKTNMIITGIAVDSKLKEGALREWGMLDTGAVKITALPVDKLSYMDRVTIIDATSEHNLLLYPVLSGSQLFAYTKYDIKGIDYIALFDGSDNKLKRLLEPDDYTYRDNVILFDSQYNDLANMCVSIRYIHNPAFHIVDILRESMTSKALNGSRNLILPIHAIGKRAHLVKDVENFDGDRLLDNSWKPSPCQEPEFTQFQRQLQYTPVQDIYDNLTATQITELSILISGS